MCCSHRYKLKELPLLLCAALTGIKLRQATQQRCRDISCFKQPMEEQENVCHVLATRLWHSNAIDIIVEVVLVLCKEVQAIKLLWKGCVHKESIKALLALVQGFLSFSWSEVSYVHSICVQRVALKLAIGPYPYSIYKNKSVPQGQITVITNFPTLSCFYLVLYALLG
jgi:hypothetical protein